MSSSASPGDSPQSVQPLPTCAQYAEAALKDGAWKLATSEHLLYTQGPVVLPARSIVTLQLRLPLALRGKAATFLVDRLPNGSGLAGEEWNRQWSTALGSGFADFAAPLGLVL